MFHFKKAITILHSMSPHSVDTPDHSNRKPEE
jgi:hypothetical protein